MNKQVRKINAYPKAKLFQEATKTRPHFSLPNVIIQVQNGNGVLKRLVPCLKCMELAC